MSDSRIEIDNLSRHYKRGDSIVKALDGISIHINRGEFTGIVGASGSGKSTLLNLIAGLDTPTGGEVILDSRNLNELTPREKARLRAEKIGMVFQSFNLLPQHTALMNVEMGLYFDKLPRAYRREKALTMLDKLGLSERLYHKPADLSGGEQQRVAFARALVKSPEILLADEPTGNLDRGNAELIIKLMNELNANGQTIVIVTHDIQMAQKCTNRLIRLSYGQVVDDSSIGKQGEI